MSWEPSEYAAGILRRREEKLEKELEHTLSVRRILARSRPDPKQKQQLVKAERDIELLQYLISELWDEPPPGTVDWEDALHAIWRTGRRHHDGSNQLLVSLNPRTLKTARKREVDLRALCILEWHETRAVDEIQISSADGELLEHLIVPGRNLRLTPDETEVYHQLRLDGMDIEAAAEVARIVTEDEPT